MLRLSRAAAILKIRLPSALPSILVGMRLPLTLLLSLAVVAEMIGNPAGLGFRLVYSQQAIQAAQAFAYLVVIEILGWGLNVVFLFFVCGQPPREPPEQTWFIRCFGWASFVKCP